MKYWSLILLGIVFTACYRNSSDVGWTYNEPQNGGFQKVPFLEQETAPGMVVVEGGSALIPFEGGADSMTVSSFYISKYEETNGQYCAYLKYLKTYFSERTYKQALPDTTLWNTYFESNELTAHLSANYLRNPTYKAYPVVGLNPEQIESYAKWKSDRMNEYILIREEAIPKYYLVKDSCDLFTTETYLNNTWPPLLAISGSSNSWEDRSKNGRRVRIEDGILLPSYRLPSEQEWQWALLAIGNDSYKYVKTSKALRTAKYDKEGIFWYLDDVNEWCNKKEQLIEEDGFDLKPVNQYKRNNYRIHALEENVLELTRTEDSYSINGRDKSGCIKSAAAVYLKDSPQAFKYVIPKTIKAGTPFDSSEKLIFGFRLAMDRIGSFPTRRLSDEKRRRKGE